MKAHEAAGEDPTIEVTQELVLDERGQAVAERMTFANRGKHRAGVTAHELVEDRALRFATLVCAASWARRFAHAPDVVHRPCRSGDGVVSNAWAWSGACRRPASRMPATAIRICRTPVRPSVTRKARSEPLGPI